MVQYAFQSKSIEGKEQKGVRDAEDEFQLAHDLRREGYVLVRATPLDYRGKFALKMPFLGPGLKDKIFFYKNLQVMLSAGLSLPRAIGVLADQSSNTFFRQTLNQVKELVTKGDSFSDALEKYPAVFSEFVCSMVRVGEETGTLDHVMEIAVSQMEKEYALKSKIKGAMIYPAVILTVMTGIGILMLATVVPELAATFQDLNATLPASTQFLIALGLFMKGYWWLAIFGIVCFVAVFTQLAKTKFGKVAIDSLALKFPAVSGIVRSVNSAYTLRNLSALVGAGVSLPRALEVTSGTVGNYKYREALRDIEERVKKGEKFSSAIASYRKIYPATAIQMVAVGEETGETSNILLKLAEFYENEVDEATKSFASVIEPMLMVVIGAAVGFFAVSMIQPMYSVMDAIK